MKTISTALATALILLAASSLAAQRISDTLYPLSGSPVRGMITKVTQDQVTISSSGAAREFDVSQIKRIVLGDSPSRMRRAAEAVRDEQYQPALKYLAQVELDARDRKVLRQDYDFITALCHAKLALQGSGDVAAAAKRMVGFLKSHNNSYHYYEALRIVGDLAIALGSFQSASTSYGKLAEAPFPEYQISGTVLQAKALQAAGNYQEALGKFDAALEIPGTTAEARRQQTLATIGRAASMAELGQPEQAIPDIKRVIAENDPQDQELFARTYNALGACYRKADQPMDAVLAYLHTHLLFAADLDSHAEAIYHLSNLWTQVDKPDKAVQMRNLLKSRYAGTAWARK